MARLVDTAEKRQQLATRLSRAKRVLAVMVDSHLGNTVVTLPTLRAMDDFFRDRLRLVVDERYIELVQLATPHAKVVGYPAQHKRRRGLRDNLAPIRFTLGLAARRYDATISICGGLRGWTMTCASGALTRIGCTRHRRAWGYSHLVPNDHVEHYSERYGSLAGCLDQQTPLPWIQLRAPQGAHERVARTLEQALPDPQRPLAVIHPGAGKLWRRWPSDQFAQVADRLIAERGMAVVAIGAPSEKTLMDEMLTAMQHREHACSLSLSLIDLLALFENAHLVVSNESGPTHLASTTPVPIVTIFGPTNEEAWRPARHKNLEVVRGGACPSNCGHNRHCSANMSCISSVTPQLMMDAVDRVLVDSQTAAPISSVSPPLVRIGPAAQQATPEPQTTSSASVAQSV